MSNAAAEWTNCGGSLGDVVLHSLLGWSLLAQSWIGVNSSFCLYTTLGLVDGHCRSAPHLRNAKMKLVGGMVCYCVVLVGAPPGLQVVRKQLARNLLDVENVGMAIR